MAQVLLYIVAYGCERKLWSINLVLRISVLAGDRTRTSIRTAQAVHADNKES